MHSTAIGYILLLASLIALAFLLQRGCKHKKKSPFYVLSMSDVFSTVLMAVALLATHSEAGIGLSYNWRNSTRDMANRTLEEEGAFPRNYNLYRTADLEDDLDVTVTCDMKDILTQYGMLLGALTNAFVSVLTFAVQCDLSAACVKKTCADAMKLPATSTTQREVKQVTRGGRRASEDAEQSSGFQQESVTDDETSGSGCMRGILMKILKFRTSRNTDNKSTYFLVASHWFVPVLVVGILYGAEYDDTNVIRHAEDIECVFQGNFPMSDFHTFTNVDVNTKSVAHSTPVGEYSFIDEDLSTPRSIEVDEVVSKIRDIIRIALNYTDNSTESAGSSGFLNGSAVQDTAESVGTDGITPRLNSPLTTERNASVRNLVSNRNVYFDQEMFRDLLKDMSAFKSPDRVQQASVENNENAQIYFANANKSTTEGIIDILIGQDKTWSDRTYNDIVKRLQAAGANIAKQGDNSADRVASRRRISIKNLLFAERNNLHQYFDTIMQNSSLHMTNKCFVSINFLKLHLLVLFFAVYFLSVLLSCVLQVRGRHTCRNTLALVSATADPTSDPPRNVSTNEDNNWATTVNRSRSESRLSANAQDKRSCREDSTDELNTSHEPRDNHSSNGSTDTQVITNKEDITKTQKYSAISEIDRIMRISNTVKLSLILCVILWTPIFLEILLKVLTCNRMPRWLTDIAFSSALFFSILRHAVNMSIIRTQEIRNNAKENRIHPSK